MLLLSQERRVVVLVFGIDSVRERQGGGCGDDSKLTFLELGVMNTAALLPSTSCMR